MDLLNYSDKTHLSLPSVTASPSSPQTMYHGAMDLVYVNTGSGWQPIVQPGSSSVYSGYTSLSAATKANVQTSIANISSAPHTAHQAIAAKTIALINGK